MNPAAGHVTHPIQAALLEAALRARDDANKIILTVGNAAAFINLFPPMLEGMRFANASGMAHHLVAVATSAHGFELCTRLHSNCVLDNWGTSLGGSPGANALGGETRGYLDLVWRKPELVRDLVHAGLHVVCMDMDIVVFKNFLVRGALPYSSGADFIPSHHYQLPDSNPGPPEERMLNAGFYFVRATAPSKVFMDAWVHRDRRTGCGNEQAVMEILLLAHSTELGVKWKGIPDNVGFTACKNEAGSLGKGPRLSLQGILQEVERIQLDEQQKERLAFVHLACFPSNVSSFPNSLVARPLAMKLISNYYVSFRNGFSAEDHANHASVIA